MTVQAANIMPTVPSYNVSQNVAKDFGCDFESFLGGSEDSVMETENYETVLYFRIRYRGTSR